MTLTPFSQSWRTDLPHHPSREFWFHLNLPPHPIFSLVDTENRQNAHNPHPQHRIRDPLAWAVSSSESKSHARPEGVIVYDRPIFTKMPLWLKNVGLGVLALFMMNLPTTKQLCQSRPSGSMGITNQTLGMIIVPVTRQNKTSPITSHNTPFGMKYPSKISSQQVTRGNAASHARLALQKKLFWSTTNPMVQHCATSLFLVE